jgi:hypothetical protein
MDAVPLDPVKLACIHHARMAGVQHVSRMLQCLDFPNDGNDSCAREMASHCNASS